MAEKKERQYVSNNAQLMAEWNWERNIDIDPSCLSFGSNKKVWWICNKGHEWSNTPNHRTARNDGCPYCSNHRVLSGFNDLATIAPKLAKEWNFSRNGQLTPDNVFPNSNKTVWWICHKGHEWEARINARNAGNGCPICKKELATSYPEQIVYYYIRKVFPDALNRYVENRKELDIYLPSISLGIEYDGAYYHKSASRSKEIEKEKYYSKQNILVLRIKETNNLTTPGLFNPISVAISRDLKIKNNVFKSKSSYSELAGCVALFKVENTETRYGRTYSEIRDFKFLTSKEFDVVKKMINTMFEQAGR